MKFKNYLDVLKNATATQKKEFDKSVKKLLKENPYDPKKKKCIGNAWFIPYTPTSRLSKQIGVKGDVNSRENSRGQHPATFPPALPEKCIKVSGIKKGSVVYDPFVGTGTTVVEAVKLGMVGIGTDIDDNFIKFSKKLNTSKYIPYSLVGIYLINFSILIGFAYGIFNLIIKKK